MNNANSPTLTENFFVNKLDRKLNLTIKNSNNTKDSYNHNHMPSRWYTVLALPFPDQKLGRRDINTFGRNCYYQSRAGFFSNPSPL